MAKVLVVYGTTEGQTRKVAEHIRAVLRRNGHDAEAVDGTTVEGPVPAGAYDAVVVGASLHRGRHQAAIARFVRDNRGLLARVPSAFFSVSLAAASRDEGERAEARAIAERFCADAGWRPDRVESVAGALRYSRYGFLKRVLMRLIARREGGPTDASRDHELTDWDAVTRFAEAFLREVVAPRAATGAASPPAGPPNGGAA